MNKHMAHRVTIALLSSVLCCAAAAAADDDDVPVGVDALPKLSAEQERAAGIVVAHPVDAELAQKIDAIGTVLDASEMIALGGDAEAAAATAHAKKPSFTQVVGLFDAANGSVRDSLTSYAAGRNDPSGPLGVKEYLVNMDRYCGFVYYELIEGLLASRGHRT